MRIIHLMIL